MIASTVYATTFALFINDLIQGFYREKNYSGNNSF